MTDSPLWVRTSSADQRHVEPVRASKLSQQWVIRLCISAVFSFFSTVLHSAHTHRETHKHFAKLRNYTGFQFTHTEFYRPRPFFFFFVFILFKLLTCRNLVESLVCRSWRKVVLKLCGWSSPASLTSVTGKNKIHKDQKVIYKGNFKWRIVQQDEHRTGVGFDSLQEELWPCLCDF